MVVRFDRLSNFFIITFTFFKCVGRNYYDGTNTNHREKKLFFKVFKLPGKKSITTVSKENFEKKRVTTTMVDFNNKFLNDSLIDKSI